MKGSWRRLWPFLARHKQKVLIAFGVSLGTTVITVVIPLIERSVVDNVIDTQAQALWPLLALLVGLGAVNFVLSYVRRFVGGRFAFDVQHDLRTALFERLQRLDFARHDQLPTGQIVSRASADLGLVQSLLSFLPLATGNVVLLFLSLIVMLVLSPLLTLIVLAIVPALLVVSLRLRATMFPAQWDSLQRAGEVAGVVDEAVNGVRVVKGFGQEDRELAGLADAAGGLYRSRVRTVRLQARYASALQAIPALGQVAVLALGGWLAIEGQITVGTFLAFSTYLVQLLAPVRMFAGMVAVAEQARAGTERIFELLDSNPLVVEHPDARPLAVRHAAIEFDQVTYGYLRSEPVLRDFSLHVAAGETVALVGASGSGKSTVSLLLPRFYDVQEGSIRIDGVDVRDATLDSVRSEIGIVFEDAFLFSDTVRANIAYGRPDATDDDIRRAAAVAGAHDFITALPHGYDTVVGERGLTLSGGQRQRISIARAVLTDPHVLVLDDATSSIDTRTEEQIHATLRELMAGRTTVLIAHRRSTLRLADRIVLVADGRALESGTHDELLATSARYRALLAGPGDDVEPETDPDLEPGVTPTTAPELWARGDEEVDAGVPRRRPDRHPGGPGRERRRAGWSGWWRAGAGAHPRTARRGRRPTACRRRPRHRRGRGGRGQRALPAPRLPQAVPARTAHRLRPGRRRHAPHPRRTVPGAAGSQPGRATTRQGCPLGRVGVVPRRDARRLVRDVGLHALHRSHRGATAVRAAHPDLRPPAATRPRLLRPRDVGSHHDPNDHRRRRVRAAAADRPDHRDRQHPQLRGRARRAQLPQLAPDPRCPRAGAAAAPEHRVVRAAVGPCLRARARDASRR